MAPLHVLITGATGCAGTHLSELALKRGARVFGVARTGMFIPDVAARYGDISQRAFVEALITETQPDWVFHLAALIPSAETHIPPEAYLEINLTGTYHVLDSVRLIAPVARVLVAGSSAIYSQPARPEQPLTEDAPLQPQSLYAVSKAAQDMLAAQFLIEHGLHTVRARTFNQTGPREPAQQVCATLARQVACIEAGLQEPVLRAITLAPRRDFTDVRDVIAGYWAALEYGEAGRAYNICSGRSESIRHVAEILVGFSTVRGIQIVETDPAPRLGTLLNQIGDASRLRACSGWEPVIPLEQSLHDLLDEWRERVSST